MGLKLGGVHPLAIFCRHCGSAIGDGVERCAHCGSALNGHGSVSHRPVDPPNKLPQEAPEELLERAMKLAEQEAYDDAILICRRAVAVKDDFVPAYAFLGEMYERVGERAKALEAYEKALALDKDYEPAKLGKERLSQMPPAPSKPKLTTEATDARSFLRAGHPLPLLVATALVIGMLFAVRLLVPPVIKSDGMTDAPPITLAPAFTMSPSMPMTAPPIPPDVQKIMRKGFDAFNAQNYEEAVGWFEQALKIMPNNNDAQSWLLLAQAALGEQKKRRAQQALAARPATPPSPHSITPPVSQQRSAPTRQKPSETPPRIVYWMPTPQQPTWQPPTPPMTQSVPTTPATPPPQSSPFPMRQQPVNPPVVSQPTQPRPSVSSPPVSAPPQGQSHAEPLPPPPSSVEDLYRQALQKVYDGDLEGAERIYRTILARGVSVEWEGDIRQQLALTLQQRKFYEEAAAEYERAIAAYHRQIKSGIKVQEAQQGIAACERGLKICRRAR